MADQSLTPDLDACACVMEGVSGLPSLLYTDLNAHLLYLFVFILSVW